MGERLEAKSLTVGYGRRAVVSGADLSLRPGEICLLIGPNGSGKSTLLRTIAGQLAPLAGTVLLQGKDMQEMAAGDAAKALSYLPTDRPSADLMTCREMVATGRYPYTGRMGVLSDADWDVVDRALREVQAEELGDERFDAVSDGQRQRILLARALCQEPEVLVLDEPTSFLDIRYKLELVETLKRLAREQDLAIVMSLHELDLIRRCGDQVVCLKDGAVDRIGTRESCGDPAYLERLYGLPAGSLEEGNRQEFRHYVRSEGKQLRCGFTTGTCAALAASGAAKRLLLGFWPETVSLTTPKGLRVEVPLEEMEAGDNCAICGVRKDAGDDVDCTAGALILAQVELSEEPGIRICGGEGVGMVTRPGLDQQVGEAAINSVPRRMIREAAEEVCRAADYAGGLKVTVSVPEGEKLAEKTFNPELGIVGGISILGTSGIVEPMSRQALVDTICLELKQRFAEGNDRLILTPGNYGMDYIRAEKLCELGIPTVKCSNFIGEALDEAVSLGYRQILLVGHIGKLVKLAGGIMNTHSRQADCRRELITAHAALCGGSRALCRGLMDCATTDACLDLLRESGLMEPVMKSLAGAIGNTLTRRAGENCRIGAILFSGGSRRVCMTREAEELMKDWTDGRK